MDSFKALSRCGLRNQGRTYVRQEGGRRGRCHPSDVTHRSLCLQLSAEDCPETYFHSDAIFLGKWFVSPFCSAVISSLDTMQSWDTLWPILTVTLGNFFHLPGAWMPCPQMKSTGEPQKICEVWGVFVCTVEYMNMPICADTHEGQQFIPGQLPQLLFNLTFWSRVSHWPWGSWFDWTG